MHNSFYRRKTPNDWKKEQEEKKWPKNEKKKLAFCLHTLRCTFCFVAFFIQADVLRKEEENEGK